MKQLVPGLFVDNENPEGNIRGKAITERRILDQMFA